MALQHLRSSTADKRPTPGAMSDGQLALNTNLASPGLFFKDSNGDSVKVGPVHVGTTAPNATPGAGGQAGNSKGEQWLDTSSSRYVFKIWDGTAWRTEDGEFVNASGDTMTGALVMDNQQQVRFRETTANGTNYIALQAPASVASDKTITLPDVTGTVVTTGDTGSVTSTMILDNTITNADINDSAAIADTKLATISTAGKVSGTAITSGQISTSGNLQITNSAPLVRLVESGGTATHSQTMLVRDNDEFNIRTLDSSAVAVSTDYRIQTNSSGATDHIWRIADTERARIDSSGRLGLGTSSPDVGLHYRGDQPKLRIESSNELATTAGTEEIGRLEWEGFRNTNFNAAASIRARQDGTWSTVTAWLSPTALEFYTQNNTGVEVTSPRLTINSSGVLQIAEAGNIAVGTTTGTKIGTATTQKLGFYNATPVVQPTAVADATTSVDVITQLNALLVKLRTLGIIAT